jgi:hypothetical protein
MASSGKALVDAILKSLDKVDELRWRQKNTAVKQEAAPGRGGGPEPLGLGGSATDTNIEKSFRSKDFLEGKKNKKGETIARGLEEEMENITLDNPSLSVEEIEKLAEQQVRENFAALSRPKESFVGEYGVGKRDLRRSAVRRGDLSKARGNPDEFGDPLFPMEPPISENPVFGRGKPQPKQRTLQLRAKNLGQEELTEPAFAESAAKRPVDPKELGFYSEEAVTGLDVLPRQTKIELKIIEDTKAKIAGLGETLGEDFQKRQARDLVMDALKAVETDESAKQLFDILDRLGTKKVRGPLDINLPPKPKAKTKKERVRRDKQEQAERTALSESKRKKLNFRRESAQAAEKARITHKPQPLKDLTERVTAPLSKTAKTRQEKTELSNLLKTLRLREKRNRKTNKPTSTSGLKKRIKELQGK